MSLGAIFAGIFQLRTDMRQAGADEAEIAKATERSVRSAWPTTREWKYLCQTCADYGLEMLDCPGDRTCGRDKEHLSHEFGRPCWCDAGAKFRKAPRSEEDFQQAGKVQKPARGFSRMGR